MPKIDLYKIPEQNLWQISIKLKHFFKTKHDKKQESICLMPIIVGTGISAHNTCEGQAAQENFWDETERTNNIIQSLIECNVIEKNPTISKELTQIFNQDKAKIIEKLNQAYSDPSNVFRINLSPNKEDTISRFEVKRNQPGCFTVERANIYGEQSENGLGHIIRESVKDLKLNQLKKICGYTDNSELIKNHKKQTNKKIKKAFSTKRSTTTSNQDDFKNALDNLINKFNIEISDKKLTLFQIVRISDSLSEKLVYTACEDNNYNHTLDHNFIKEYLIDLDEIQQLLPELPKHIRESTKNPDFFQGIFDQGDMQYQSEDKTKENFSIYIQFFIGILNFHCYMNETSNNGRNTHYNDTPDFGYILENKENLLDEFYLNLQRSIIENINILDFLRIFFQKNSTLFGLNEDFFETSSQSKWCKVIEKANRFAFFLGQQGTDAHKDEFLLIDPLATRYENKKSWRQMGPEICLCIDKNLDPTLLPETLKEFDHNNIEQNQNLEKFAFNKTITTHQLLELYDHTRKRFLIKDLNNLDEQTINLFAKNAEKLTCPIFIGDLIKQKNRLTSESLSNLICELDKKYTSPHYKEYFSEENLNELEMTAEKIVDLRAISILQRKIVGQNLSNTCFQEIFRQKLKLDQLIIFFKNLSNNTIRRAFRQNPLIINAIDTNGQHVLTLLAIEGKIEVFKELLNNPNITLPTNIKFKQNSVNLMSFLLFENLSFIQNNDCTISLLEKLLKDKDYHHLINMIPVENQLEEISSTLASNQKPLWFFQLQNSANAIINKIDNPVDLNNLALIINEKTSFIIINSIALQAHRLTNPYALANITTLINLNKINNEDAIINIIRSSPNSRTLNTLANLKIRFKSVKTKAIVKEIALQADKLRNSNLNLIAKEIIELPENEIDLETLLCLYQNKERFSFNNFNLMTKKILTHRNFNLKDDTTNHYITNSDIQKILIIREIYQHHQRLSAYKFNTKKPYLEIKFLNNFLKVLKNSDSPQQKSIKLKESFNFCLGYTEYDSEDSFIPKKTIALTKEALQIFNIEL